MKIVNAEEMREIDRVTIEEYGITSSVLMERAGLAVVGRIMDLCDPSKRVVVLSGGGNNGGDGLVVARNLHNKGLDVSVYLLSTTDRLSRDCKSQFTIAKKTGLKISEGILPGTGDLQNVVVVDAVIGTGLNKPVKEKIAGLIERVNDAGNTVFAVDIPTGISSDDGKVMGAAIRADVTVTFGLPKLGHVLSPGAEHSGKLYIEDIGFPHELLTREGPAVELIDKDLAGPLLPSRVRDSYKGMYGHVLVVGGSQGKTGAALLSARAVLRSGAGLVTIASAGPVIDSVAPAILEEMTLPLPCTDDGTVSPEGVEEVLGFLHERADVVAIGPGLGREKATVGFILEVIRRSPLPMVIDADALFALSTLDKRELPGFIKSLRPPSVLTPHIGEMARLLRIKPGDIKGDPIGIARKLSEDTGCCIVLKGSPTIVASPEGRVFINSTGNPGMSTAGTGDVLTGMIASLTGQNLPPLEASILGVYLHGLAGDIAAERTGEHSLIAGDVIEGIPGAFSRFRA
ncbi:bifunctional NAD(P)H-hydrate repair enzyme Nnr [bacterium BMS3Bbin06]|nr:bifunctional NAD(P)H-hydrate repair enzyme Nnr [bacterium BMS3Abin08]GBE35610.1 bifunctional NAD(P)H-hydrate repair enzyme Nnr [bacterium BMS3Bbin06]